MRPTHLTAHLTQTGINTNLTTYILYQDRLIKIPAGLRLNNLKSTCVMNYYSTIRIKPTSTKSTCLGLHKVTRNELYYGLCSSQHSYILNIHARIKHLVELNTLLAASDWKCTDAQNCETLCLQAIIGLIG